MDLLGTADAAVVIQETWPCAQSQLADRQDEGCGSPCEILPPRHRRGMGVAGEDPTSRAATRSDRHWNTIDQTS